jgi:hypothetical protein
MGVYFNERKRTIELGKPISGQDLYNHCIDSWIGNGELLKLPIPIEVVVTDVISFINGWRLLDWESKLNLMNTAWKCGEEEWALIELLTEEEITSPIYYKNLFGWTRLGERYETRSKGPQQGVFRVLFTLPCLGNSLEFYILQGDRLAITGNVLSPAYGIAEGRLHAARYVIPVFFEPIHDDERILRW